MVWLLSYHRSAVAELYAIPRGEAFYITDAISALQQNPYRPDAELRSPGIYRITVRGHIIEYLVTSREIKILYIQ